ncbi:hypothetical protein HUJ05_000086 [Dendroctonus ponderosae]|nr:hypothetical protein HUJ05_000086 [Dendroctonus ponderosae]
MEQLHKLVPAICRMLPALIQCFDFEKIDDQPNCNKNLGILAFKCLLWTVKILTGNDRCSIQMTPTSEH